MKNPSVSIILPVHNTRQLRLTECIQSILDQTYTDFELIIINDASTNDIEKTILQFVKKDSRIQYIKNIESSKGIYTNILNQGISLSQGAYIARMDDDDIWCDNKKLEKQILFLEKNKDIGICGTNIIHINEDGTEIGRTYFPQSDEKIRKRMMKFNQFAQPSVVFRKDVVGVVGNYNPNYNMSEDYELWLRIGTRYKLANLPDYTIKYRHNNQSVSTSKSLSQGLNSLGIAFKYRNKYPYFWLYCLPRYIIIHLPREPLFKIVNWIRK